MPTEPANTQSRRLEWRVFPAIAIIAIGILFLLNNLGVRLDFLTRGNWWAWFILIAAVAPLTRAYEIYRARRRLDAESAHHALSAAAVVLVAVMFLADLDWGVWWPLFVILGGLFTLVRRSHHHDRCQHHSNWHTDGDATLKR